MNPTIRRWKYTMVTVNYRTLFLWLPEYSDGKTRMPWCYLALVFGVKPNECYCIG